MMLFNNAEKLLYDFKKDSYNYGSGVLDRIGKVASRIGSKAVLFRGTFPGSDEYINTIYSTFEVTLNPVIGGQAKTDEIDVLEFASY